MRTDNANWARTLKKLRRMAAELAANDWQVIEPPNAEVPPAKRLRSGGVVPAGAMVIVGEHGSEMKTLRPGQTIKRRL